jgi:DNA-binding NarL/FixJ family response regulator
VLLREGAARLLAEAGHEVVGQAGDADDLLRMVRANRHDVAIIDVRISPDNTDDGLRAALAITGGSVLDPDVVAQMLGRPRDDWPLDSLTEREREVLALMAEGRTHRAIAGGLYLLSERAVERHATSIFGKLDLPTGEQDHRRVLAVLA